MPHEFNGKQYAAASSHQKEWGTHLIEELNLHGKESILDLGCGDGALSAKLAELVPGGKVVAIDASQGMLNEAAAKSTSNLSFIQMDINDIDFRHEFDIVFSNAALHWVKDHHRLYTNVRQALRPGGRIRFNFAGAGNCSNLLDVVHHALKLEEFAGYFRNFEWPWYMPSVDEYQSVIDEAGFREAEVWGENADRYFPDMASLASWLEQPSLVPFLTHLPKQVQIPFRDYVVGRMGVLTRHHDGTYFETFRRINVAALV